MIAAGVEPAKHCAVHLEWTPLSDRASYLENNGSYSSVFIFF